MNYLNHITAMLLNIQIRQVKGDKTRHEHVLLMCFWESPLDNLVVATIK